MDDLSGLVWATELPLDLLSTSFVVRGTSVALGGQVEKLMRDFVAERLASVPPRRRFALVDAGMMSEEAEPEQIIAYRDCSRLGPPGTIGLGLTRLVASLNRDAIEAYPGFAVHSGVVASGDRAIGFPAGSGGGKSTLTAACLMAGMAYVSDEALGIDSEQETVVPYPKPIALGARSLDLLHVRSETLTVPMSGTEGLALATDLGSRSVAQRTRLAHVVLPEFEHQGLKLEEVPSSEAMVALLEFSFNHYKNGERAFRLAASLASGVRAWRLAYANPLQAAEAVGNLP